MTAIFGMSDLGGQNISGTEKSVFSSQCQKIIRKQKLKTVDLGHHIILSTDPSEQLDTDNTLQGTGATILAGHPYLSEVSGPRSAHIASLGKAKDIPDILKSARGTFVGVALRNSDRELSLFTDKLGLRPLYYFYDGTRLVYSSIKYLIESLEFINLSIDDRGLAEHLLFGFSFADRTQYNEIKRLAGAQVLKFTGNSYDQQTYWDGWPDAYPKEFSDADVDEAYDIFREAIKVRLESEQAPVAFLSGGLDSRAICSQLADKCDDVFAFNFSPGLSQEGEFAKLYAQAAEIKLHQKDFPALNFPNFSNIIRNEIELLREELPRNVSSNIVWSGDGGSVTVGGVYLQQDMLGLLNGNAADESRLAAAVNIYWDSKIRLDPRKYLNSAVAKKFKSLVLDSITKEMTAGGYPLNEGALYRFFMNNDQRRHLDLHFETIGDHAIELQLPFFDGDFLGKLFTIAPMNLLNHEFYMKWFSRFPESSRSVPWQTYPGHLECPLKLESELPYQWDSGKQQKERYLVEDFQHYWKTRKNPLFKQYFNGPRVLRSMTLHRFGVRTYPNLVRILRRLNKTNHPR